MDHKLASLKSVIRTKKFDAAREFYHSILELEIVEEYDDGNGSRGCILSLQGAGAFIEISEIKPNHSYYQSAFNKSIESDKIDIQIRTNTIQYWASKLEGIWESRGPIDRPWGSKYLYLRDPDGLHIIIYEEKSQ